MHKSRNVLAFVMVTALSLLWVTHGRSLALDSQDERDVERVEEHWLATEDDPAAVELILAEDFVHALPSGFISKREQIDYLRSHPPRGPKEARKFDRLDVRVYGNVAIATGIFTASQPSGATRKTVFTDVFVKRNGSWLAVNSQENPMAPPIRGN